jgi:methylamine dehydrogenase heavy chain
MQVGRAGTIAMGLLLCAASLAGAQTGETQSPSSQQLAESHTIAKLSPTNPRRLFVTDVNFPSAQASRTYILDGSTGKVEGMLNQGYWPNFSVAPDGSELYAVDSYWEKHTRGKRSDYLVVRDARTLEVKADVPLPEGRLLVVSKKYDFDVTPDGRYGLTYNLAPSTEVTVTDLKERKPAGSVSIAGCGLVYAQGPNRFSSLCSDGAVLTASFDASGTNLTSSTKKVDGVFDAGNDPAFEHSAWDKKDGKLYLLTYRGNVIPVDLTGEQAVPAKKWSLTTSEERKQGWLPGGWQLSHFHTGKKIFAVLMHQGRFWTQKAAGKEAWIFDAQTGKRTNRIRLQEAATSVALSPDEDPLLYVITESSRIDAYRLATGKRVYRTDPIGVSPLLLTVWGE